MTEANTYTHERDGHTFHDCRTCKRLRMANLRARRRAPDGTVIEEEVKGRLVEMPAKGLGK